MPRYSTIGSADVFRVLHLNMATAQFWIGKVFNEGQKGRCVKRDLVFTRYSGENLGYWISHRIKENKEFARVVSGTPCVQRVRVTKAISPSRGNRRVGGIRSAPIGHSEKEGCAQAQIPGHSGSLPGSRSSNLAWVARICSAPLILPKDFFYHLIVLALHIFRSYISS